MLKAEKANREATLMAKKQKAAPARRNPGKARARKRAALRRSEQVYPACGTYLTERHYEL